MSTAQALYGGKPAQQPAATPPIEQPAASSDAPAGSIAARLYTPEPPYAGDESAPQAIKDERAADPARGLYSPQSTYQVALPDDAFGDEDARPVREVMADLAVEPNLAAQFRVVHGQIARGEADPNQWAAESERLIATENYTDADLHGAWAAMNRNPVVFAYLDKTGLGAHPEVVRHFVAQGRAAARRR